VNKEEKKDEGDQDVNLVFSSRQLDKFDEIPHQKDSMFLNFDIVRSIKELESNGDMAMFMQRLNKFLHIGNLNRPDE